MLKQCSFLCGGQKEDSNRGKQEKRVLNLHFSSINYMYDLLINAPGFDNFQLEALRSRITQSLFLLPLADN